MLRAALLALSTIAAGANVCAADEFAEYHAGLRERGLFGVSEGAALRAVGDGSLAPIERLPAAIELSRTFAVHAAFSAGAEREALWVEAAAAPDRFGAAHPGQPGAVRLEVRRAEVAAERALLRATDLLRAGTSPSVPAPDAATVDRELADAAGRLDELGGTLEQRRRDLSAGRSHATEPLPAAELVDLATEVRVLLAEVLAARAELAPADSPTRGELATRAETLAGRPSRGRSDRTATWRAVVVRADAARLAGRSSRAKREITLLEDGDPGPGGRAALAAAAVRVLLDEGRHADAADLLAKIRTDRGEPGGELSYWEVAVLVRLAGEMRAAGDDALAAKLLTRAGAVAESAAARVGGPWAWRAAVVVRDAVRSATPADAGSAPPAVTPPAAADLPAVRTAAKNYADDPTPRVGRDLRERLAEHRRDYPDAPSFAEATWRLARLEEARRQRTAALPLFRELLAAPRFAPDAAAGVARMHEGILGYLAAESRTAADPTVAVARQMQLDAARGRAITELTALADALPDGPLPASRAEQSLRTARVLLGGPRSRYDLADRLFARVSESARFASSKPERESRTAPFWRAAAVGAAAGRAVTAAAAGRFDDARTAARDAAGASPATLLATLDRLAALPDDLRLGVVRVTLAEALARNTGRLSAADRRRATRHRVAALRQSGRTGEAVALLDVELAAADAAGRTDVTLWRAAADLFSVADGPDRRPDALTLWNRIAAAAPAGSSAELAARLRAAGLLADLGRGDEAARLLAVTRVLHPAPPAPLRRDLDRLSRRLSGRTDVAAGRP